MRKPLMFAIALSLTVFAFTGCKSAEEKACENLAEQAKASGIESDDFTDVDKCVEEAKGESEDCSNKDAMMECMGSFEADSEEKFMKEIMGCLAKCED